MTRAFHALERSLRDGPPDESGYEARSAGLVPGRGETSQATTPTLERVHRPDAIPRRRAATGLSLVAAVAIAIVLAAGGALLLGRLAPGEVASTPTTPFPALTETFLSPRHGFSVRYPSGWTVTAARVSWKPNSLLAPGNAALDELQRGGQARLVIASQRLESGQSEEDWLAAFRAPYQSGAPCGTDPAHSPRLPIGGVSAWLVEAGCPLPADNTFSAPDVRYTAFAFAGGRVYLVSLDGAVDLRWFEDISATIRLDPASAIDP